MLTSGVCGVGGLVGFCCCDEKMFNFCKKQRGEAQLLRGEESVWSDFVVGGNTLRVSCEEGQRHPQHPSPRSRRRSLLGCAGGGSPGCRNGWAAKPSALGPRPAEEGARRRVGEESCLLSVRVCLLGTFWFVLSLQYFSVLIYRHLAGFVSFQEVQKLL